MRNLDRILPDIEHIIISAYQDMEGVMLGKKGYKLRHAELTNAVLSIVDKEIQLKALELAQRMVKP